MAKEKEVSTGPTMAEDIQGLKEASDTLANRSFAQEKEITSIKAILRIAGKHLKDHGIDISGHLKGIGVVLALLAMVGFVSARDLEVFKDAPGTTVISLTTDDAGKGNIIITGAITCTAATVSGTVTFGGGLDVTGNANVSGAVTAGTAKVTGSAVVGNALTVGTNVYVGGSISNTALTASKPVFTDANKVLVSTGTLGVDQGGSGAATFTDNGVLIGNAASAFSVTAVGTDGQVFLGASGANPTWGTMSGDASIAAGGAVTVNKGLAMTNGASLGSIPTAALVLGGANIKTILDAADYAAVRTALTVRPGTDVQAYDAGLDTLALDNGGDLTNLNASNLASGTVANDRLDTNSKKVGLNDAGSLTNVQAATALIGVVPLANGGAGNASGLLKANGAGLVSAASAGTDYLAPATVWGYPGLATVTNLLVNTVTITAKDTAGATLAGFRLIHVWVSPTDKGAASTNNIETLVLSTGTAISTVTANADYWYCTAVAGTAVATVTATAAGTNYLMVADGSSISSIALVETE